MNTATGSPDCAASSPRLLVSALLFALIYIGAVAVQKLFVLPPLAGAVVSLLPAASLLFFLLEEVKVMRRLDELQRQIHLEALAVALLLTLLALMTMGFLQRVDLLPHSLSTLRDVWGVVPIAYFFGLLFARRRYL